MVVKALLLQAAFATAAMVASASEPEAQCRASCKSCQSCPNGNFTIRKAKTP